MRKMINHLFLITALTVLFISQISCKGEGDMSAENEKISLPPSLIKEQEKDASQIVTLTEEQSNTLNIATEKVRFEKVSYPVSVPAVVEPAPENIFIISAPIQGLVVKIHAHEGENVKKGDVLVELESLEFAELVADYLQNNAEEAFQKNQYERLQQLFEKKIKSQRELEKAEVDYELAAASARASYARLLAVGVEDADIMRWRKKQEAHPHLSLKSPLNGIITEHLIDMGQAVNRYEKLGTIVNPSRVLVRGYVSPEDAANISTGNTVKISLREDEKNAIASRIQSIVPILDEQNRSITVNSFVANPPEWMRSGRNVRMTIEVVSTEPVVVISIKSVQYDGNTAAVFVRKDMTNYEKRFISIERIAGEKAILQSGLTEGEEVATTQIFTLKALSKYGEFAEE